MPYETGSMKNSEIYSQSRRIDPKKQDKKESKKTKKHGKKHRKKKKLKNMAKSIAKKSMAKSMRALFCFTSFFGAIFRGFIC